MMLIIIFIVGYLTIAFEHTLHINKAAPALISGVLCWLILFLGSNVATIEHELLEHFGEISSILFFLLGAMTIVEVIDSHNGFSVISQKIWATRFNTLIIIVASITFFLSALLDNLTTAIVMTSLLKKIVPDMDDRKWFAGLIIIASNAGGIWSPIGDVTTTMLWIGGQVSAMNIIKTMFLPSLAVCLVPVLFLIQKFKGKSIGQKQATYTQPEDGGVTILAASAVLLIGVPMFKTITHLPPFMGMLLALGILWIITTVIHLHKLPDSKTRFGVANALQKIDTPSILFFLGILLAVSALQTAGVLSALATVLDTYLPNDYLLGGALGVLSALVDNVPLVAAAQGMYSLQAYPLDHTFWEFLALTSGAGGSMIIIGSAAGVAVMGIEKISFGWYLKKISLLACLGFLAGIMVYLLQERLLN